MTHRSRRNPLWGLVLLALAVVTTLGQAVFVAAPATADTSPAAGDPATASAAALPTWQINGVAWSQVVVGNTVYVTGSFATARPPGVAVGGAGEVAVGNIFAYDITTGNRVTSFNHTLNGQGRVITASPDGTKLYVGGDFTTVDGQARGHIASFDVATGALNSFNQDVNGTVRAITANNASVYYGGSFTQVNGASRGSLAAATAAGALRTNFRPGANATVWSMVLTPDNSRVIVGGQFTSINGVTVNGSAALDGTNGVPGTWLANNTIRDATNGAIGSLSTDGTHIYGTGWAFGAGASFEGTFAANPADGSIVWLYDCQGDTYGAKAIGDVVYSVGHSHDCTMIDKFPDTNPRVRWQHSLAFTKEPRGTNKGPDVYGWNYNGQPAPAMLHWFPTWATGQASGQSQAGWAINGDSRYVTVAGEFPAVNGSAQQGLVRFGIGAQARKTLGPTYTTNPATSTPTTDAWAIGGGKVRVSFGSAWDKDNESLSYQLLRDGTTPVGDPVVSKSNFWTLPTLSAVDPNPPAGNHTYRVRITDPDGNTLLSPVSNTVTASASLGAYADAVLADDPAHFWRLGDTAGRIGTDLGSDLDSLVAGAGVAMGASGTGIKGDDVSGTFSGDSTGVAASRSTSTGRDSLAIEGWFKTTSNAGGKIIGFGDNPGGSGNYDRHVYLTNDGRVTFGLYPGGVRTLTSAPGFNDGNWHQVVGNLGPDGMSLWVDGIRIGRNASVTGAQPYTGKWAIGGDNLGGWPDQPSSQFFAGSIDEVAIYNAPLTRSQIRSHYTASGRTLNVPPRPTDTYGGTVYDDDPDFYYRFNDPSTATSAADAIGTSDGKLSDGPQPGHAGAVGYAGDSSFGFDGNRATVATPTAAPAPSVYSEELWFKTNTTSGGKLIGYGDTQSGNSGSYDRHVWMLNNGHLVFGTWTGQTNTVESQNSYNDNTWHHLVANQGPDGMKLYVDGTLVGTNPQTQAQAYNGYWRIGGDTHWGGADSTWFAGDIDEVAVYSKVLSQATIRQHYAAGGGTAPNVKPTAAFTSTVAHKTVDFDGTGSTDSDGTIASYAWDFGDGTSGTGATPRHVYDTVGTFAVSLTVTDNLGGTHTVQHDVVTVNNPPTARFTSTSRKLKADFDAGTSSDGDGSVASYTWEFGDGVFGSGATPSHTYPAGGTFDVKLTVTDDDGATDSITKQVTVVDNQLPTARFTSSVAALKVSFDSSTASDADGTIASRSWDFGDGTSGTGVAPNHTYAAGGNYDVTLTVTDDDGATDSVTQSVTTVANQKPTARFTYAANDLVVGFDASTSSDPDGTIASRSWAFGDNTSGVGVSPTHTYPAPGTYSVTLTVTDNKGDTDSVTKSVVVTGPIAADAFARTVTSGLGTADTGGAWQLVGGAANYAVSGGWGQLRMAAAGRGVSANLPGPSSTNTDLTVKFRLDKLATGGGAYVYVTGRGTSTDGYRAKVRVGSQGAIGVSLGQAVGGSETNSAETATGLTLTPNTSYSMRVQVTGTSPTTTRVKLWPSSQSEPSAWLATRTDSTPALQTAGGIAVGNYLSGTATNAPVWLGIDDLVARAVN